MRYVFILFFALSVSAGNPKLDKFFRALAQVESSGNPRAYNKKEKAIGIYQIRPLYYIDSGIPGGHGVCYDPAKARAVCEAYFRRYEPKAYASGDFQTLAKLHNGGASWRKKDADVQERLRIYWRKVKNELDKMR